MPKYNSPLEIVDEVLDQYENVTQLSVQDESCMYSNQVNGVGCAVGCLIDEQDAQRWEYNAIVCVERRFGPSYEVYFRHEDLHWLHMLQVAHDDAVTEHDGSVEWFIEEVKRIRSVIKEQEYA